MGGAGRAARSQLGNPADAGLGAPAAAARLVRVARRPARLVRPGARRAAAGSPRLGRTRARGLVGTIAPRRAAGIPWLAGTCPRVLAGAAACRGAGGVAWLARTRTRTRPPTGASRLVRAAGARPGFAGLLVRRAGAAAPARTAAAAR